MRHKRAPLPTTALLCATALSACGDGDPGSATRRSATTSAGAPGDEAALAAFRAPPTPRQCGPSPSAS